MALGVLKRAEERGKYVYLTWRYRISYIGSVGMLLMYCMRVNMSVAIVCMVKPMDQYQSINTTSVINASSYGYNATVGGAEGNCEDLTKKGGNTTSTGTFEWPRSLQGSILAGYFYGYAITQVPGGWLSGRFGAKIVIIVGLGLASIATLLVPVAARWNPYAVMVLRIIVGLGSAVTFPSYHHLWSRWAPRLERTKLVTICVAGSTTGNILIFFLSGLLCVYGFDGGWPSIFYICGISTLCWLVIWTIFVYDTPEQHPWVSQEEVQEIRASIGEEVKGKNLDTPWLDFVKSPAIWAIIVAHFCNNFGAYTMMVCLPMYMKDVLKFNIKLNGVYMALPYLVMSVSVVIVGQIVDLLRTRGVNTGLLRKLCMVASSVMPSALLIGAGFVTCEKRMIAVALLIIAVGFTSFSRSGYVVNHLDIAPKYAGVLYGITNTFGTLPGFAAPLVAGKLTSNGTREEWLVIFYICAGIYTFGVIFYAIFAKGEVQSWALEEGSRHYKSSGSISDDDHNKQPLNPLPATKESNSTSVV